MAKKSDSMKVAEAMVESPDRAWEILRHYLDGANTDSATNRRQRAVTRNLETLGYRLVGGGIEAMLMENPANTPHGRERRRLEKQGKSENEVARALAKKWPDTRTYSCIVYTRKHRSMLTELAKELIKRGIAIDYEYVSMEETKDYGGEDARFLITIKDKTTPVPRDLEEQISEKYGLYFDCYDDEFEGTYGNPRQPNPAPVSQGVLVGRLRF